jgi:hypothetical protein
MKNQSFSKLSGLCLASVLLLSSCQDDAQVRAMSDQIRALEMAQGQSKAELSRVQLQMRSLQAERDKIKEEKEKLQLQIEEAKRAAESIKKDFDDYKQQYKLSIRKRAPGMELELVEVDGKKFEQVKIRELTETTITFMHAAGTMSASLKQLTPELQAKLGFETAMPVMANLGNSGGAGNDLGIDQELDATNKKLTAVTARVSNLQRSMQDANRRARDAEVNTGEDPTIHRQAAAAYQVQINEAEVEMRGLQALSRQLAEKQRMQRTFNQRSF